MNTFLNDLFFTTNKIEKLYSYPQIMGKTTVRYAFRTQNYNSSAVQEGSICSLLYMRV